MEEKEEEEEKRRAALASSQGQNQIELTCARPPTRIIADFEPDKKRWVMVSQEEAKLLIEWLQALRLDALWHRKEQPGNALSKLTQDEVNWCIQCHQRDWDWSWRPRERKEVLGCDDMVFAPPVFLLHPDSFSKRWQP